MPSDGNGVYTLPGSFFVQNGDTVLPVQHNPPFLDVAQALTNRVMKDGRTVMTGNLQMGGNKVTNVAPGTNDGDALNVLQLRDRVDAIADFATVADMLADNNQRIGYTGSGARVIVSPGQIFTAQGFRYEVVAGNAASYDVETAGGVRSRGLGFEEIVISSVYAAPGLSVSPAPETIRALGFMTPGDGGTALYKKVDVEPVGDKGQFSITLADGVTVAWYVLSEPVLIPQMLGARGDGTGDTPADDGVDIEGEPWNTWDGNAMKDSEYSPYRIVGPFDPPRPFPFQNTDTWDYIGIQRAMWFGRNPVYIPGREDRYVINLDNDRGFWNGLILTRGQEKAIYGDGQYDTLITTKEDFSFFSANHSGEKSYYKLFTFYRNGGPTTTVRNINIEGPAEYFYGPNNLCLAWCANINALRFDSCWLSASFDAIYGFDHCSGFDVINCTMEYVYNNVVFCDDTSEAVITGNIFFSMPTPIPTNVAIKGEGSMRALDNQFHNYYGGAFSAESGVFSGNKIYSHVNSTGYAVEMGSGIISGNTIDIDSTVPAVRMDQKGVISGNHISQDGPVACIVVGNGSDANSAIDIILTSNLLIKTDDEDAPNNYAILAPGASSWVGAADPSTLITGNVMRGRSSTTVGSATMPIGSNVINGSPV